MTNFVDSLSARPSNLWTCPPPPHAQECSCGGALRWQAFNFGGRPIILHREGQKIRNRILLALPPEVREEVLRHCHHVELPYGHVIYRAGAPVEHVYFIDSGLVSLVKTMEDGRGVEIGAAGSEGLVGLLGAYGF